MSVWQVGGGGCLGTDAVSESYSDMSLNHQMMIVMYHPNMASNVGSKQISICYKICSM